MFFHFNRSLIILFIFVIFSALPLQSADKLNIKYSYWPNGKPKEARFFDRSENLIGTKYFRDNGKLEQCMGYDIEGNVIDESYYDIDGNLCKNPLDNWAAKKSKYIDGKLREVMYFNENRKLTERDYYSEDGDITDRQFFGDSRIGIVEDFKPSLEQFEYPQQEIDSRLKVGEEIDEFYDSKGNPKDETVTVND